MYKLYIIHLFYFYYTISSLHGILIKMVEIIRDLILLLFIMKCFLYSIKYQCALLISSYQ